MPAFDPQLAERIEKSGNIAVVVIDDAAGAIPLARALLEGGVTVMELTLRTATALESLRTIAAEAPAMLVGAGTVLTPEQVHAAADAGAAFGVAPGLNPAVLEAARERGLSFAPGVMTPSDIEAALAHDCRLLKFFPAEAMGGIRTLATMAAPYKHLGLKFIPLGGLNADNTAEYLSHPLIAACGGSWMVPARALKENDWETIRELAARAASIQRRVRPETL